MSSTEKAPKSKPKAPSKTKSSKGKEVSVNDQRFRGDGVKFKCKLVGAADVASARGDSMCAEAIKKLKVQALKLHKESGEHKQKIVMYISIKGIRIVDEKTQKVQYEHPINKISFITHDPEDKRIFGYVCSQPCTTGHKMYAIKSEKPAGAVTGTLYELFQVVFKLRQEAGLSKKVQNSSQVQKPPQVSNGPSPSSPPPSSDGIYEVPYKNGNNKQATPSPQLDHEYAEPVKPSRNDPHYKVPTLPPAPAAPSSQTGEKNWEEHKDNEKTMSADALNTLTLLNQSQSFDKDPDQVSQASIPDSPFPPQDSSSTDMNFFGPSVFDTAPSESGAADTVSVASSADVSMLRSGSVSSGSSDTRSAHSRSGSLNQKVATEEVQPGFATTFDDDGQTGQEVWERMSEENNSVAFPSSGEEEKVGEKERSVVATVEESFASNPDPFASSTNEDERTQPVAGEGFFTESFAAFDTAFGDFEAKKSDVDNQEKDELFSNDPFARSVALEQGSVTESGQGFASESTFEAAFSSEQATPSQPNTDAVADDKSQGGRDENPVEEKSKPAENSSVSFSWDTSFGENEDAPQQNTTQSAVTSETVQFSWAESFPSDNADVTAKPSTSASFNWDDAFGGAPVEDKESSNQAQDAFSWDNAFGDKATNGSDWQFESSPFGDAFSSASKVESSSDTPSVSDLSAQPVAQSTANENPSTFEDSAFSTPSSLQISESKEDVSVSGESNEIPPPSKDPFEEFKVSFPSPGTNFVKITSEETADSSESEGSNTGEELSPAKENTPDELRLEENEKETVDLEEIDETVNQAEDHDPAPRAKYNTEVEQVKEERPSELQVQESRLSLSERPISPTAPPPLPPRPAVSAPPLPARPPSSSSTVSTGMTSMSQHLSTGSPSDSPHQGKKGSAKKTPPPPPPRVDLNEKSGNVSSDKKETFPDPFGSNLFDHQFDNNKDVTEDGSSDWEASWPSAPEIPPKEKTKDLSDPFSDNFFTNFDFPQKPASNKAVNDNLDPFATANPTSEAFPVAFGNEDLFAAFTPAKVDVAFGGGDPFQNDLSDSFSAFPSDDPFSDISDPFADKGILGDDPFGDSPSKPHLGESLTLNESLVASDEADSFA